MFSRSSRKRFSSRSVRDSLLSPLPGLLLRGDAGRVEAAAGLGCGGDPLFLSRASHLAARLGSPPPFFFFKPEHCIWAPSGQEAAVLPPPFPKVIKRVAASLNSEVKSRLTRGSLCAERIAPGSQLDTLPEPRVGSSASPLLPSSPPSLKKANCLSSREEFPQFYLSGINTLLL